MTTPEPVTIPVRAVVVLVGPPASGKTWARRRLVEAGFPGEHVVGLDDLRRDARSRAATAGEPVRPLQDYSLTAVRASAARRQALLSAGWGYLADATHTRRRERAEHVRAAGAAGLPAVALLFPDLPLQLLLVRDALRPADERVPPAALAAFAHRRSLLTAQLLRGEGFAAVYEVGDATEFTVLPPSGPGPPDVVSGGPATFAPAAT
jgi:predicted kinase